MKNLGPFLPLCALVLSLGSFLIGVRSAGVPYGYAPRGGLPDHCEVRGGFAGPVDDAAGTMRYHLVCASRDEWDTPYIIVVDENTFRTFQFGSEWKH